MTINVWFCGCIWLPCTQDLTTGFVGAWWFETVIAGPEWDRVLFTKILNDCSQINLMEIVLSVRFLRSEKLGRAARIQAIVEISVVAFSNVRLSWGPCWDELRSSFKFLNRIKVWVDLTENIISWDMLFAWQCVSKHTVMFKTHCHDENFWNLGPMPSHQH